MTGHFGHTTFEVIQGYLLSPMLFNIFLEQNTQDTLQNHKSTKSAGGKEIGDISLFMSNTTYRLTYNFI